MEVRLAKPELRVLAVRRKGETGHALAVYGKLEVVRCRRLCCVTGKVDMHPHRWVTVDSGCSEVNWKGNRHPVFDLRREAFIENESSAS